MKNLLANHPCVRVALGLAVVTGSIAVTFCVMGPGDRRTLWLFANTLRLAVAACAINLPVSVTLAVALLRTDIAGRRLCAALLGAMLFVPLYIQTAAWNAGFGLQGWLAMAHAAPGTSPWLHGMQGAVWVHAMAGIPWSVLIIGVGLRLLPTELEEHAWLDASPISVFWHVTLPRVGASVWVAALWILVVTASEIAVTDVFGVRTFAEELYVGFALGDQLQGRGLFESRWAALPGTTVVTAAVAAGLVLCAYLVPKDDISVERSPRTFATRRWRWPLTVLVWMLVVLVVCVPIGNLIYKAGVTVQQVNELRVRSWSPTKTLAVVAESPWRYRAEFLWTFQLANLVALLTTMIAIVCAWMCRTLRWTTAIVVSGLAVCLAVPGPMIGLGLIHLLNQEGIAWLLYLYDQTLLAPCLALTLKCLPLATMMIWYGLRSIPDEVLDAAALEGAGRASQLIWVAIPQRTGVLVAAYIVAMALAMGDLAASILVMPPGVTTLSIRIFNLVHYGVEDQLAGVCLSVFGVFTLISGAAFTSIFWQHE